jgi:2-polyprenyl-3-methyl-5-hydroxy-6-metoxy-1,4-benzoquinol methylase
MEMMDFSSRSYRKEMIDDPDIPAADIERNMQELDIINTWLGGHAISVGGLKQLLNRRSTSIREDTLLTPPLTICEIGCGGGDNLAAISRYCSKKNIKVQMTGVDWNANCIEVAKAKSGAETIEWIVSDYRTVEFKNGRPDIIFSSLFCHHFTEEELIFMLEWMEEHAGLGWFINDLHRHPVAWFTIRWLTRWFSRSLLVKNDAPLSVLRGFTRKEWKTILQAAGMTNYSIRWKWAFRWLIVQSKSNFDNHNNNE